jgi:hypothetical protein
MGQTSSATTGRSEVESRVSRIAAIDAEIARLTDERAALVGSLALRGEPEVAAATPAAKPTGSFAGALTSYMESQPQKIFTIGELYHAVAPPGMTKRRLRSALFDLMHRKPPKVARVAEGKYQAARATTRALKASKKR